MTPDGQHIISSSDDTLVKVWDVASQSLVCTCAGHVSGVWSVAVTPNGERILSGSCDNTHGAEIGVWLISGNLERAFSVHTSRKFDTVLALVALPDNQHALFGTSAGDVKLFNVNDGGVLRSFSHHLWHRVVRGVYNMALMPDGRRFVSGSEDSTARICEHGFAYDILMP